MSLITNRQLEAVAANCANPRHGEIALELLAARATIEVDKRLLSIAAADIDRLTSVVKIANAHGWNGTDNSKILEVFVEGELDELAEARKIIGTLPKTGDGRVDQLRRLVYRMTSQLQGNFWRCLKCQYIVHSYRQVHACSKCGNGGGSGWWTSTSFEEWEKLNPMPADFEADNSSPAPPGGASEGEANR